MANDVYPKYKEALLGGSANIDLLGGTVKVALVDTGTYTYSAAHHEKYLACKALGVRLLTVYN